MATQMTLFNNASNQLYQDLFLGGFEWYVSTTWKLALLANTFTLDVSTQRAWADVSAHEISHASYTAGGNVIENRLVDYTTTGMTGYLTASNVIFNTLNVPFRHGIIYQNATLGVNAVVDPLFIHILFDDTPADISPAGDNFTVTFPSGRVANLVYS